MGSKTSNCVIIIPNDSNKLNFSSNGNLVLSIQELDDILEYFESGELPWHQNRGLKISSNNHNIIAITSKYPTSYQIPRSIFHRNFPMKKVDTYFQEFHAFDKEQKSLLEKQEAAPPIHYCGLCCANYDNIGDVFLQQ